MIGARAFVVKVTTDGYKVSCYGELWNAKSDEKFELNDEATVNNVDGLTLEIRSVS